TLFHRQPYQCMVPRVQLWDAYRVYFRSFGRNKEAGLHTVVESSAVEKQLLNDGDFETLARNLVMLSDSGIESLSHLLKAAL
ncbi:hypothetical protein, partial [Streptococcus sp. NLN64]|uniref:hypothetical protein n=1 Tax=Streptococcus sp. NLN64 TaxID=2822799 RepID=UPI001B3567BB